MPSSSFPQKQAATSWILNQYLSLRSRFSPERISPSLQLCIASSSSKAIPLLSMIRLSRSLSSKASCKKSTAKARTSSLGESRWAGLRIQEGSSLYTFLTVVSLCDIVPVSSFFTTTSAFDWTESIKLLKFNAFLGAFETGVLRDFDKERRAALVATLDEESAGCEEFLPALALLFIFNRDGADATGGTGDTDRDVSVNGNSFNSSAFFSFVMSG
mmetsp:Transcript_10230/g.15358  ORF Transcript_10230/g.15358 Transcript_10230/m.15358 type:complete len:215 (-) Transcript_10230:1961-2605(-)